MFLFWPLTIDDSYITYRYAQHLANGAGISWNPGEGPIEGCTAFLWLVLLAAVLRAGFDVVLASKIIGVLALVGSLLAMAELAREMSPRRGVRRFVPGVILAFVLYPATTLHAVSGMETSLFTLTVCLYLIAFLRCQRLCTHRSMTTLAVLALICGLVRPEGNLFVGVTLATGLLTEKRFRTGSLWLPFALVYVLPGLLYFLFRMEYFGHLLPSSFYVKAGSSPIPGESGFAYVYGFLRQSAVFFCFSVVGVIVGGRRHAPIAASAVLFVTFYLFTNPIMGYSNRYLHPVLPVLLIFATVGVVATVGWLAGRRFYRPLIAALLGLLVVQAGSIVKNTWYAWKWTTEYSQRSNDLHIPLGRRLKSIDPSGHSLVVLHDVGAISYHSEWRSFDLVGMNSEEIAFGSASVSDIISLRPDVVVMNSYDEAEYIHWGYDHAIYHGYLKSGMARAVTLTGPGGGYFLHVLARPETKTFAAIHEMQSH